MAKVKVTLKRSVIGSSDRQRKTLEALGLKKINSTSEHTVNDQINGMIRKVSHLVEVVEVK